MKYKREHLISLVGIILGIMVIIISQLTNTGIKIWKGITDLDL